VAAYITSSVLHDAIPPEHSLYSEIFQNVTRLTNVSSFEAAVIFLVHCLLMLVIRKSEKLHYFS
jgi:hypothetical protein